MIFYENEVIQAVKKGRIPKPVFTHLHNAFLALDKTKDLNLFDIRRLRTGTEKNHAYFRLRKSKYRAIFYIQDEDFFVIKIDKREEVYKQWE